jgi:hypothetical protein
MRVLTGALCALLVVSGCPSTAPACSQCMCGTPFPGSVLGGVVPRQLSYGVEERYLSKSNALDEGPGLEQEREHRVSGFLLWRAADRLALLGRVPYNVKQITERPLGESGLAQRSRGLGDLELLAMIGLLRPAGLTGTSVGLVLGGAAPTGSNVARDGTGRLLDAHLQPGAGAWSGTAGLNLAMTARAGVWDASLLARDNTASARGYRYGRALLYNAGFTSVSWKGVRWLAQVNGRTAARDRLEDATPGENTGGTVLYAAPGLRWESGLGLTLDAGVQVPLIQSLFGDQTEHTTGRLSLTLSR